MLQNREGQKIPNVTFKTRVDNMWVDVTTEQLFNNKTVVVFSLPGAFTPTCSSSHVPRYNELADAFKQNGVDDIVCNSVNDTFVMNEWKKGIQQLAKNQNVFCKLSGMVTEANLTAWKYNDFVPYMDVIVECFGTDRIMFGSDWPVCLVAASYKKMKKINIFVL